MVSSPPSYADIRLITGEQRSGKSNSMVAYPVEDYYENMDKLVSPSGEFIPAKSIDDDDEYQLKKAGIFPDNLSYCRVFDDIAKRSKLIKIPPGYLVMSPIKIFANFHLFGVKFAYITLEDIIVYINSDLLRDGWVLSDESVMSDSRNSMTSAGKIMSTFTSTIGKRNIHFLQTAQLNGMVDRRIRAFATTRINCSYDEHSRMVTCDSKFRSDPVNSFSYFAPKYWRFFDTQELIKVPEKKLASAYSTIADVPKIAASTG